MCYVINLSDFLIYHLKRILHFVIILHFLEEFNRLLLTLDLFLHLLSLLKTDLLLGVQLIGLEIVFIDNDIKFFLYVVGLFDLMDVLDFDVLNLLFQLISLLEMHLEFIIAKMEN